MNSFLHISLIQEKLNDKVVDEFVHFNEKICENKRNNYLINESKKYNTPEETNFFHMEVNK